MSVSYSQTNNSDMFFMVFSQFLFPSPLFAMPQASIKIMPTIYGDSALDVLFSFAEGHITSIHFYSSFALLRLSSLNAAFTWQHNNLGTPPFQCWLHLHLVCFLLGHLRECGLCTRQKRKEIALGWSGKVDASNNCVLQRINSAARRVVWFGFALWPRASLSESLLTFWAITSVLHATSSRPLLWSTWWHAAPQAPRDSSLSLP